MIVPLFRAIIPGSAARVSSIGAITCSSSIVACSATGRLASFPLLPKPALFTR